MQMQSSQPPRSERVRLDEPRTLERTRARLQKDAPEVNLQKRAPCRRAVVIFNTVAYRLKSGLRKRHSQQ